LFDINMLLVWHIRETEYEDTLRAGPKPRPPSALRNDHDRDPKAPAM
jgi:hypothetical protein